LTYLAAERVTSRTTDQSWDWVPFRRIALLRRQPNASADSPLLACSASRGVELRPPDGGRQLPSAETIDGYWLVNPGDLVFNPMWAIEGGVAVSELFGAVSTAYRVYQFRPNIWPRFLHYWCRSSIAIDQYRLLVRGITTFDRSVSREDFEGMPVPVPPISIQRRIADFLDVETARLNELGERRKRQLLLIDERFGSAVTTAIVSSTAPRIHLRWLARVQTGITLGKDYGRTPLHSYPYLRVANVLAGRLDLSLVKEIVVPEDEARGATLRDGDVLMTEGGDNDKLGRGCVWRDEITRCLHQNHIFAVRPDPTRLLPDYLAAVMASGVGRLHFTSTASQSTNLASTNTAKLLDLPVPVPPLHDQRVVINHIQGITASVESLRGAVAKQIDLMDERRHALITAAVSGQMPIPGVAA
jgi:type I restriction enzyme S subunit